MVSFRPFLRIIWYNISVKRRVDSMNQTPKIISRLIDNEYIRTYTGAKSFIDGYCFCLSDEAEPRVLGLTENRILPGFNIFIKNFDN